MRAHPSSSHHPHRVAGAGWLPVTERDRLSPEALKLHVFAVLASIYEQHPGIVDQRYLDGIRDDVTEPLRELIEVGLWAAAPGRYRIPEREVRRIAQIVHDQVRLPPAAG